MPAVRLRTEPDPTQWRPWTQEELELVAQLYGKVPIREIVAALREHFPPGRTYDAVRIQARRLRSLGRL